MRAATWPTVNDRVSPAASSTASGRPSTARQMAATATSSPSAPRPHRARNSRSRRRAEGLEAHDTLTVDPQRDAAGDEHRQLRAGASNVSTTTATAARSCSQLSNSSSTGRPCKPGRDAAQHVALAQRRGADRVAISSPTDAGSVTVASSTSCTSTPAPTECRGGLQRQPGLADTGRSDQRHDTPRGEGRDNASSSSSRPTIGDRADASGADRERQSGAPSAPQVELAALLEDRLLERAQLGSGFQAELLGEDVAHLGVGAQRVGLPSGAVERQHALGPESLLQRMLGDETGQLADQVVVPTAGQIGRHPLLDHRESFELEARRVRRRRTARSARRRGPRRATATSAARRSSRLAPDRPASRWRRPSATSSGELRGVEIGVGEAVAAMVERHDRWPSRAPCRRATRRSAARHSGCRGAARRPTGRRRADRPTRPGRRRAPAGRSARERPDAAGRPAHRPRRRSPGRARPPRSRRDATTGCRRGSGSCAPSRLASVHSNGAMAANASVGDGIASISAATCGRRDERRPCAAAPARRGAPTRPTGRRPAASRPAPAPPTCCALLHWSAPCGTTSSGKPVGERAEHRARTAVADHGIAPRQHVGLRDERAHDDAGRLRAEHRRIVLAADRDDDVDVVAQRLDHRAEHVEVGVPDRPQRQVHRRRMGQRREELRRLRCSGRRRPAAASVAPTAPRRCRQLQHRRTRVDVQVAEQAGQRSGRQTPGRPVRSPQRRRRPRTAAAGSASRSRRRRTGCRVTWPPAARRARRPRARRGRAPMPTRSTRGRVPVAPARGRRRSWRRRTHAARRRRARPPPGTVVARCRRKRSGSRPRTPAKPASRAQPTAGSPVAKATVDPAACAAAASGRVAGSGRPTDGR